MKLYAYFSVFMQVESVKLLMLEQPFDKHHPLDHHQSLPFFCFLAKSYSSSEKCIFSLFKH